MKRIITSLMLLISLASSVNAQVPTATPASKIGWSQVELDANNFLFKAYIDNSQIGVLLTNVTCEGTTSPLACQADWPPSTPGVHTLTMTATNAIAESGKSLPFAFDFVVNSPGTPQSIHVI